MEPEMANNITSTVSFFAARSMMGHLFISKAFAKQTVASTITHRTMDSLFAKADAIQPLSKKSKPKNDKNRSKKPDTRKNASTKPGPSSDRGPTAITPPHTAPARECTETRTHQGSEATGSARSTGGPCCAHQGASPRCRITTKL